MNSLETDAKEDATLRKEIRDNDEKAKRNYCAGELQHKHGYASFEDEQVAVAEAKKKGVNCDA
jgi:hypothetical protein